MKKNMVGVVIAQEMGKLDKIKLFLLLMIIHHILTQECTNEPAAPAKSANAKIKCLQVGACKLSCKSRYLFPSGENSVYYECVEGRYKLKTDNPEQYKECKPVCKPPCGNGGNCVQPNTCDCQEGWTGKGCKKAVCEPPCSNGGKCVRPNTCDCPVGWTGNGCQQTVCEPPCSNGGKCVLPNTCECPVGWTGNGCQQKVTSKSVITTTPTYTEDLVTTTEISTTLLQSTFPFNSRSSMLFNVTEVIEETTNTDVTYLCTETTYTTYDVNEHQDSTSVIPDSMNMSPESNVVQTEQTMQSSTELLETTIDIDGDFSMTSNVTNSIDMGYSIYDNDINTTISPFTEFSETTDILTSSQSSIEPSGKMINNNEGLTISSEITDIIEIISTTNAEDKLTTPQSSTESSETIMKSNTGIIISSEITDIIKVNTTTDARDILTTPQSPTESSESVMNNIGISDASLTIIDINNITSTINDEGIKTTPTSFKDISKRELDNDEDPTMSSPITDIIDMDSSMYDAEKEVSTQILIEFIQTTMDNGEDTIDYTVPEVPTGITQSTVLEILPVTESTNYPELSTLLEDSTKVSQETMMTDEEIFSSTDFFTIEEETEITYNSAISSILSTYKLDNLSTEETTIFHMVIGNNSNNNDERYTTQSTNRENSTSELFLTTSLSYDTSYNITTHKNILSYILSNLGFGLQENADCDEPLWWLVPLLLAITALLTSTNVILSIITLKWRNRVLELQKRIANHRKQSMPITFFRTLEFNAEIEYPAALSNER